VDQTYKIIETINANSTLCLEVRSIANDAHTTLDSKIESIRVAVGGRAAVVESDVTWPKVVDAFRGPAPCYATNGLAEYTTDVEVSLGAHNIARVFIQAGDNRATVGHRILDAMHDVGNPTVIDRKTVQEPIPMLLTCPMRRCGRRHIDEGEFATKLHATHSCQYCGCTWKPAKVNTVGVKFLPGYGPKDDS
jgi:hypothetical protein